MCEAEMTNKIRNAKHLFTSSWVLLSKNNICILYLDTSWFLPPSLIDGNFLNKICLGSDLLRALYDCPLPPFHLSANRKSHNIYTLTITSKWEAIDWATNINASQMLTKQTAADARFVFIDAINISTHKHTLAQSLIHSNTYYKATTKKKQIAIANGAK